MVACNFEWQRNGEIKFKEKKLTKTGEMAKAIFDLSKWLTGSLSSGFPHILKFSPGLYRLVLSISVLASPGSCNKSP